jgi:hypothetical protein
VASRVGPAPGGYQWLRGAENAGDLQRPEASQDLVLTPECRWVDEQGRPWLLLETSVNMPRTTPPHGVATSTKCWTNRLHQGRGRRSRNWCANMPPKLWDTIVTGCLTLSRITRSTRP